MGINNLSGMIIHRPDLVLMNRKNIETLISKIDKNLFIDIVNNDIEDLLLFGI